MEFVWSDDLARALVNEDGVGPRRVAHWVSAPIAYRLPDDIEPINYARQLLDSELDQFVGQAKVS